ncbi:beta carbonic anhydrase 1-like [Acanthaster planci]|uniref:Carbonic anhydrase n=1 Tax=Acanthaster planci TaxID=133434 RepID=A0A8B7YPL7_ACAPL|nr:beta carbonic anhydrase 1-like [Acanthaster planci]
MEKILRGIIKYKANTQGNFLVQWATLAQKQHVKPPILFISCIDSRVLPTHFCQTSPGDMFLLRNAGNVIPQANYTQGEYTQSSSEVVALEITCNRSKVEHVVVCGHSDCQALYAAYSHYREREGKKPITQVSQLIHQWSRTHGVEASLNKIQDLSAKTPEGGTMTFDVGAKPLEAYFQDFDIAEEKSLLDKLSKVSVLQQLEHLSSYHSIRRRVIDGSLSLHGMWYDIAIDKIYWFSRQRKVFLEINEENIDEIVRSCQPSVADKASQNDIGHKIPS